MFNDLFKTSLILMMSVAALSVAAAYDTRNVDRMKSDFEKEKMHKWGDKASQDKMGESVAVEIDIANDSLDLANEADMGNGVLEVAVLGSENFDVNNIDPSSLAIGDGNGAEGFLVFDQNDDGIDDLIAEFSVADLNLQEGTQELTVKGKTKDGKMFKGSDQVTVTKAN